MRDFCLDFMLILTFVGTIEDLSEILEKWCSLDFIITTP